MSKCIISVKLLRVRTKHSSLALSLAVEVELVEAGTRWRRREHTDSMKQLAMSRTSLQSIKTKLLI